ncbi:MAG: S41 family peptidase [Lachnospiraceae bacterium]
MEEKDEQILETADALREDIRRIEHEQRKMFCKGIALGGLTTLAICLLVFFVIPVMRLRDINKNAQEAQQQAAQTEDSGLLTPSVESKIERLADAIDQLYYEDVDEEDLVQGLYKGLLEGVGDSYTAYYTPEEYKELMISATSSLSGIGIVMQQNPDTMQVTVNYVYEGSPAEKAGILAGDLIVQAGDAVATSMELSEFATQIRGDEGTTVHLKLYRYGKGYLELDVERAIIDVPTLKGEMLDDGIGYIMIAEFGNKTAEEFADTVSELKAQGMTSMIVDLRNNPGGIVDSVTAMLDQILPEGVTVWTEDKYGNKKEYTSDAACLDYPMVVLINGNSASSSEIFAGAIRDYKYGTLIGTKTFGKGIVQSIRRLADGSAIKLTTSRYFTPSGQNIHGEGIEPDIKLEYKYLDPDATEYDMMNDNQILKAIEVLKKEK